MKQYFAKHPDGKITQCNWPIKETGAESFVFDVTEQDLQDVASLDKDWKIEKGILSTVTSDRKAKLFLVQQAAAEEKALVQSKKMELVQKITEGKATAEEQQEFVNLI